MRTLPLLSLMSLAMLAACHAKPSIDAKNASAADVAKQISANGDMKPHPGHWDTVITFEKMDMPGMNDQMRAIMQKGMGAERHHASCLTPEEAAKPRGAYFNQAESGCSYEHFTMGGGRLDEKMKCDRGPGKATVTMTGTYGPDTYSVHTTSEASMGEGHTISTAMTMTAHRTGACDGTEPGHIAPHAP